MVKPVDELQKAFMISRACAIESYATIEASLCTIVAELLRTPNAYAGIIFFRITSSRSRIAAVEALIHKKYGNTYNAFWNPLTKLVVQTDQRRNEIVHWHTVREIGDATHEIRLTPPNFWDMKPTTPSITVTQMDEFSLQCDFIARSINIFSFAVTADHKFARPQSWLDICQQPLVYPPPDDHLLSPNYKEP